MINTASELNYAELARQIAARMSPEALLSAEDVGATLGYPARYIRETIALAPRFPIAILWLCLLVSMSATAQVCPYDPRCVNNPYGAGSPYNPESINNPYGPYGSPYSNQSANNPYATDAPKLYDSDGNYLGRLSANPYDPDSTSNPYGQYGSPYSPDSINNPYGPGNPYNPDPIYVVPQQ